MKKIKDHNFPNKSEHSGVSEIRESIARITSSQSPQPPRPKATAVLYPKNVMDSYAGLGMDGWRPHESEGIRTGGEILGRENILELVKNQENGWIRLLHWKEGKATISEEFGCPNWCYVPSDDAELFPHLPSEPLEYGSTEVLFTAVTEFIKQNSGLDSEEAALLAFFSFSSFFGDCLSTTPCLLLFGAPLPVVSLLRILGCVCRHALLSAGSSVRGTAPELRPTRLICQADATLDRQLAALQFSGFSILNPRPRQISGATVIYAGDAELKSPFAETCLQLWVSPSNRTFGMQDEDQQAGAIANLQNQLLLYRIRNYSKVQASSFDISEFSGVTREFARSFGRCLVDAPDLQARLTTLLASRSEADRTEGARLLDAVVVEALVVCCHERRPSVHVGEIATVANEIFKRNDEPAKLTAKQVGFRLRKLGFRTTRIDADGRGIYLLNGQCARVHKLGLALAVPTICEGLAGCPYCQQR